MKKIPIMDCNVLVIGTGSAGLRAAIEAHDKKAKVLLVSTSGIGKAHSINAEGGINAALGNVDKEDNWKIDFEDTLKEGHDLGNKKMIEILCKESIDRVLELDKWGLPFDRTKNGKIDQRYFGAHRYRRTCYSADRTGFEIVKTLVKQVKKRKIKYLDGIVVTSILVKNNSAYGVTCVDFKTGKFFAIRSKAIVLAIGGYTKVYKVCTHPEESFGDGVAMAFRAGCELQDMEMVQFHPTGMAYPKKALGILATEAFRGEGAKLFNANNERFMQKYDPKRMELSARDVIARAIYREIEGGRGTEHNAVWLDITQIDHATVRKKLPKMYKQFLFLANKDITKERVEVTPTAHYTMGGIRVDPETTETNVKNLLVVGEASAGLHGANRLGGNSLAETLVFGKRAGFFASKLRHSKLKKIDRKQIEKEYERIIVPLNKKFKKGMNVNRIKEDIRQIMWDFVGIKRDVKKLKIGLQEIRKIKKSEKKISISGSLKKNHDWLHFINVHNMLLICESVIKSALMRTESRGAHWRADYPQKDDKNWKANIICRNVKGKLVLQKVKT